MIVSLTEMLGLYSVLLIVHQGLISPLPFFSFLFSGSVSGILWSKENSNYILSEAKACSNLSSQTTNLYYTTIQNYNTRKP